MNGQVLDHGSSTRRGRRDAIEKKVPSAIQFWRLNRNDVERADPTRAGARAVERARQARYGLGSVGTVPGRPFRVNSAVSRLARPRPAPAERIARETKFPLLGRACKKALVTYQGLGGNALLEVVDVEGTAGGEVLLDALEGRLDDGLGVAAGLDGHRRAAGGELHGLAHHRGTDDRLGGLGTDDAGAHRGAGAEAEAEGVHGHGSLHFRRVSLAFGPKNALCEVTIVRVPAGQLSDCTSLSG